MSAEQLTFMPLAYNDRPVMVPPQVRATDQLVLELRVALEESGGDVEWLAQWVAERIEEFGAMQAEPVFDMEGSGPICSWCGVLWPLCGHSKVSEVLGDDDSEAAS